MVLLVSVALIAFGLSVTLTSAVRRLAVRANLMAQDRVDRWHTEPTPVLGGIGIFVAFGTAVLIGFMIAPPGDALTWIRSEGRLPWSTWDGLVLAGVIMFLIGAWDDVRPLRPVTKMLWQVIAASVLIFSGVMLRLFGILPLDVLLSVLWFVGITNALNLLDNMDGLAGGIAAIAAFYLGVIFVWDGLTPFAVLAFALCGAIVGFLVHDYPPAKIFMGDAGSLFLGIFLAGLALSPAPGLSRGLVAAVSLPALILAIPILDTTLVTAGRMAGGRPIHVGGKDHTSHRLVALGVPGDRAIWILWGLAAASGAIGLMFRTSERAFAYLLGGLLVVTLALLGAYFLGVDFRERDEDGEEEKSFLDRFLIWHSSWPVLSIALDLVLFTVAYYGAYLLRWDATELPEQLGYFGRSLSVVVSVKFAALGLGGVYRRSWRYFGVADALSVVRANFVGSLAMTGILILVAGFGFSRGVMIIDFLLCSVLTVLSRSSIRILERMGRSWKREGLKSVVVGAERDAVFLISELEEREEHGLRPVAIAERRGTRGILGIRGYAFFRGPDALERAVEQTGAEVVVTVRRGGSWPKGTGNLEEECDRLGVGLRIIHIQIVFREPGSEIESRTPASATVTAPPTR